MSSQSYEDYQADVHSANTAISSWRNCPCDKCRERQAEAGLPLARFSNEDAQIADSDLASGTPDDDNPPF